MTGLAGATRVEIPRALLQGGHDVLRQIGCNYDEGLVLWAGTQNGTAIQIAAVLVPKQRPVRTNSGVAVLVSGDELHRIGVWLHKHRLELVGQVHSHPADAYHSELDDAIPIASTSGALSLVVPDFAAGPPDLSTYAVYRLSARGAWTEVPADDVAVLFHVTD